MAASNRQPLTSVTVRLLDSLQGSPVQSWQLDECTKVTIGRAMDNDIVLADPRVSRLHTELAFNGSRWVVRSHGRHGTFIDGEPITDDKPLSPRTICRLGPDGPSIQVLLNEKSEAAKILGDDSMATIDISALGGLDFLSIDESRKSEEVDDIIKSDSFRSLLEQSRLIKQSRSDLDP